MNHQKKLYVSICDRSRDREEGSLSPPPLPPSIKVEFEARSVRVKTLRTLCQNWNAKIQIDRLVVSYIVSINYVEQF